MLEDRDYMRPVRSGFRWLATLTIIAVNAAVFIYQYYLLNVPQQNLFEERFALSLNGLRAGHFWQLITYQFMHGGFFHVFLNCWAIFVFGRAVEITLGKTRMLALYFLSGLAGGLLQMLFGWLLPNYFGDAVVGASAGAMGLISAYAVFYPEQRLGMLLFFVIPMVMKARTLLWFLIGVSLVGIMFSLFNIRLLDLIMGNLSHTGHLGGILAGFAIAHLMRGGRPRPYGGGSSRSSLNITASPD
jgi:membrane associated rhomboid family serine protease